ncbi:unnamed protein product [Bubo scandiacus]
MPPQPQKRKRADGSSSSGRSVEPMEVDLPQQGHEPMEVDPPHDMEDPMEALPASGCTGSQEGARLPGEPTPAEHGDTPYRTRSCSAQESGGGRRNGEDGRSGDSTMDDQLSMPRQLGAHPALSLSLPALSLSLPGAQDTRRSQEAPSDPCPVTQAPGEGAEPPPCRECLSGLGAVSSTAAPAQQHRHHCSPSAAASLLPVEAVQHQEPGEAGGRPGRGAAGCAAAGRTIDGGDISQSRRWDRASGAAGGLGLRRRRRPGKPARAAAGRHPEGLPPEHPLQAPRDRPLRGLDGGDAEGQQGGEDLGAESGGREVACGQPPPPEAAAVPPPAHRPPRSHQQDGLQQPGRLRWAELAEPSPRGPAPTGGHAGDDPQGTNCCQIGRSRRRRAGAERRRAADPGLQEEREAPSPPPGGTGGHQAALPGAEGADTRRSQEAPSDPCPVTQAPGEGAEPPPCLEAVQHQEPGEAGGRPGRGWAARGRTSAREGRTALGSGRWTWLCRDTQPLVLPTAWRRTGPGLGQAVPGSQEPPSRSWQAGSGCSRALFGQPLAALCGEDGTLPRPIQELLAVLQQEGPSTEGIFRRAAGGTELRELREALDCGADVDLGSQPALLLAAILKDFLRSIPCKLLVTDLYEDWMAAMQKASREEKIWELRAVAEKLPAANLLLLKRLLSLLQHIGHHAATSRMGCSNLAVCVGPNLLSPAHADLLPLEAMLEMTHKVNVLVEFLMENCRELFEEEAGSLSSPADKELPAPLERFRDLSLEEKSVPAGKVDTEHQAEALLHAPPSLLGVLTEAGGDTVVESETGEAPPALPPATPESTADSLGRPEQLAGFPEERRFAGSAQDEEKKRSRKRREAWGEESESCPEKKRRKREGASGDGPAPRHRQVQQVGQPRVTREGGGWTEQVTRTVTS